MFVDDDMLDQIDDELPEAGGDIEKTVDANVFREAVPYTEIEADEDFVDTDRRKGNA